MDFFLRGNTYNEENNLLSEYSNVALTFKQKEKKRGLGDTHLQVKIRSQN